MRLRFNHFVSHCARYKSFVCIRYKTETRPGLVALYDIRPGNRAGQFLQLRSPHGTVFFRSQQLMFFLHWD